MPNQRNLFGAPLSLPSLYKFGRLDDWKFEFLLPAAPFPRIKIDYRCVHTGVLYQCGFVQLIADSFYVVWSSSILSGKGASIYYIRKIFGILDPLPPLIRISRNLSVLPFAILGSF